MSNTSLECTLVDLVGAVYCITDMIIFHIFEDLCDKQQYMQITVTVDDINEFHHIFRVAQVPSFLSEIYAYVKSTSAIQSKNNMFTLYGNHIGRKQNHAYNLLTFNENPIQNSCLHVINLDENITDIQAEIYNDIFSNMTVTKNITV